MDDFKGKSAIVTGAASGIGAAIARELAARGASVIVADRDFAPAERLVAEITSAGGVAKPHAVDVANAEAVEKMVAFAVESFGRLDLAVNNAGIGGPISPVADYPLDGWKSVIDINLNGVFYGVKYEIAAMLKTGGGSIVNMASILGTVGTPGSSAYVSAKHGVVGLTEAAALEYAQHGIRVNAVGPGYIETPLLTNSLDTATLDMLKTLHPVGRLGTSEEVSALTCFLLSDAASFITGSYHLVDGGYTAH